MFRSSLSSLVGKKPAVKSLPTPQNHLTHQPSFKMSQTADLACTYAALILDDGGADVSAENIAALVKAAGVTVPPYLPGMYAKVFAKKPISELISNVGAGGGGGGGGAAAGGGGGGGAAAEEKEEEKKEESEEEGDDDMGFSLFD